MMSEPADRTLPGHGKPGERMYPKSPLGDNDPRIPTGRDVEWEPLVDYRRNGVSETTIHGAVAWASGDRIVHSFGGNVERPNTSPPLNRCSRRTSGD
jgi:hypothetical protein